MLVHHLAAFARACGYKVVLSGEGADELFGGYNQHDRFQLALRLNAVGVSMGHPCGQATAIRSDAGGQNLLEQGHVTRRDRAGVERLGSFDPGRGRRGGRARP